MALRVVGAGMYRTGTNSLKVALEHLLGGPCYHMYELFGNLDHAPIWRAAVHGSFSDLDALLAGYSATVDIPGASLWRELSSSYPDSVVLLSTRRTPQEWWHSVSSTMVRLHDSDRFEAPAFAELKSMIKDLGLGPIRDADVQMANYQRHNEAVRNEIPAERLVDWQPGDGWEPICRALGLAVPEQPFPHVNSTESYLEMHGLAGRPA